MRGTRLEIRWFMVGLIGAFAVLSPMVATAVEPVLENDPETIHAAHDYFLKDVDKDVRYLLGLVEKYHLTEDTFWAKYKVGHYTYAVNELLFVLRYFPNHPKALFLLSFDPRLTPDRSVPIRYFERAISLYPQHAYTYAQYGRYLISLGKQNAGRELLKQALELDPNLFLALGTLAEKPGSTLRFGQPEMPTGEVAVPSDSLSEPPTIR